MQVTKNLKQNYSPVFETFLWDQVLNFYSRFSMSVQTFEGSLGEEKNYKVAWLGKMFLVSLS